jgi:hypothetical protein
MPTPKRVPDPTVIVPAEDMATLEAEKRHLLAFLAVVAEGSDCNRNSPRHAGRICGAANNLVKQIEKGLTVWRPAPPNGHPLPTSQRPDSPPTNTANPPQLAPSASP